MTDDVFQKFFWMVAEVMLVTGFTLTHLVKYSTTIMVKVPRMELSAVKVVRGP
jgi:hypothetical protein